MNDRTPRSALIDRLARLIGDQPAQVTRVAVHGPDTAGKTTSGPTRLPDVVVDNTDPAFPRTEVAAVRQIGSLSSPCVRGGAAVALCSR